MRPVVAHLLTAAAGAAITLLCTMAWQASDSPPVLAAERDTAASTEALQREVAALRQQLADQHAGGDRTVATPTADAAAPTTAHPSASEAALLERLLRELDEQRAAGLLRQYFAERPDELAGLLLRVWLETGSPARALQLLLAVQPPLDELDSRYPLVIARALRAANSPLAHDAYLHALRLEIQDAAVIADLAELDATAGLAALDAYEREHAADPTLAAKLRDERFQLLLGARQTAAALALFDELLAAGEADGLWGALIERAPAAARERLQKLLAATTDADDAAAIRRRLVDALLRAGDRKAARAEIEALLAADPTDSGALARLARIDPAASEAALRQLATASPSTSNLQRLADALQAAGKHDEAATTRWSAFVAAPADTDVQEALLATQPQQFAERILAHARSLPTPPENFDELLGNVADAFWGQGLHGRAIALWKEAQVLEPSDSEWPMRLQRIAAGRDPMAHRSSTDWWRHDPEQDY